MKISELPDKYRDLANKRKYEDAGWVSQKEDDLNKAFIWMKTPEGYAFWDAVYKTKTIDQLPAIPEANQ